MKTAMIDTDTGEVFNEHRNYFDKSFCKRGYLFRNNSSRHLKVFRREPLPKALSLKEVGMFYKLSLFLEGENQLLAYWTGHGMQPLTVEKMCNEFGCTDRQVVIFLNKLTRANVIKEVTLFDKQWYMMNPKHVMKGKYLTQIVFSCFHDELKNEVPKSVQDSWI